MRRIWPTGMIISVVFLGSLTGCTGTADPATEVIDHVKEKAETYMEHRDVNVHTEQEMREFALSSLEKKYGKTFVIDESYCVYQHFNGHEDVDKMELRARACPVDATDQVCGLKVIEPNTVQDNYFVYNYKDEIAEMIRPAMDDKGLSGDFIINYPLMTGDPGTDLSAEEFLNNRSTELDFFIPVRKEEDPSDHIPLIRQWLSYLYTCDYNWYFALVDEEDGDYQIFGVMKDDSGIRSEEEWTDEMILHDIKITSGMNG